ncbi:MAG TPA: AmmeMemoRadiSam system protein B [Thermoanaerobaculia bacterium]|nr:AmmeMemoRadiSam system protein B [Thermoanaerobaculia bacterium]
MHEREPAVAGTFYEEDPEALRREVMGCFSANEPAAAKTGFIGAVVPHAGLMYSGHVAAALYQAVELPRTAVILCPNHTGAGKAAAINLRGSWRMPFGPVPIDEALAQEIATEEPGLEDDRAAHAREHSLEVQLPFLQILDPGIHFVPICIKSHRWDLCESIGKAIARVLAREGERGESIAMLASSDLNHYEDQRITLEKDQLAIDAILALDARELWDRVQRYDISMCGILPTVAMLLAARDLGASSAELIKHATSGDINHDYGSVVGYASIVIR